MRMKIAAAGSVLVFSMMSALPAHAGLYGDDLARCMVEATTKEDREVMVRWLFGAMSANPAVSSMATVSSETMDKANAAMAKLTMRLLTESCRDKAKVALKHEGTEAFTPGFTRLFETAGGEIFANPEVEKAVAGYAQKLDKKKLGELDAQ